MPLPPTPPVDPEDDPFAFTADEHDASSLPAPVAARPSAPAPAPVAQERVALVREMRSLPVLWSAGAALVLVGAVVLVPRLGGDGASADVRAGDRLPVFAAPLATRPRLEFDAVNLATGDDQGPSGRIAACEVRGPSVVTSCGLLARGPLALVLYRSTKAGCLGAADAVDASRPAVPGISVLTVAIDGRHDETAATVRARRWSMPVAYDRDGWLGRRLGSPSCEALLMVGSDGVVRGRTDGRERGPAMRRLLRSLAAG